MRLLACGALATAGAVAVIWSGIAWGETPSANPPAAATVDAIVVTAQKREQSLQNVPVVVTAVGRQLLQDSGVHDIKDLTILTPGLIVTSTTSESSTTARIRGIGTVGDNIGLESSVGVVIDGVFRPRNGVGFGDLGDLDRIEVLKGPQGTLFGKSTSAGVINILTEKPSFTPGANAEFTTGNYSAYGGAVYLTGPLYEDKLAGSFYFADRQRSGFYTVDTGQGPRTDTTDQDQNFHTFRAQLRYEPDSRLSVRAIADYTLRQEHCCSAVEVDAGETTPIVAALGGAGGGEPLVPNPAARTAYANQPTTQNVRDEGVSVETTYRFPALDAALTAITAYRDWKRVGAQDTDFSNADLLYLPASGNSDQFKTFSQEVRFAGTAGKLDYLAGAYYAHEDLTSNFKLLFGNQFTEYASLLFSGGANPAFLPQAFGASFTPGEGAVDHYHQIDNTYAVFTNDTFHITDKLELNAGIRFTEDEKSLDTSSHNTNGGAACAAVAAVAPYSALVADLIEPVTCLPVASPGFNNFTDHQSESEGAVSATAKLDYRFNRNILTYLSYSRGYKAGGFNLDRTQCAAGSPGCAYGSAQTLVPLTNTSFPGEFVNSYEAGVKTTLLDRKLLLNATLFYQDFSGFQLNTFTGLVFVVDSIPTVISRGVDADFVWLPTRALSFQGGLTVADTHFTPADLPALTANGQQFLGAGSSRISLAPLYSGALSGTYKLSVSDKYQLRFNIGAKFTSAYNTGSDLDPRKTQPAFALANGRVAFGPDDKRWSFELWSENLFDKRYEQVAFDAPFQNAPTNATGVIDAFLGAPRTFGMTVRAKY